MHPFISLTLLATIVLVTLSRVNGAPYPFNVARRNDITPLVTTRSTDLIRQLGPQLSANATIFTDDDPRFINATARWSEYSKPQISVVVDPGTEADVATIVKSHLFIHSFILSLLSSSSAFLFFLRKKIAGKSLET